MSLGDHRRHMAHMHDIEAEQLVKTYAGLGELVQLPASDAGVTPAWHLYVVRDERADELHAALQSAGIGCKPYYRRPLHRQPALEAYAAGVELPVTDALAESHLAIPMSPVLGAEQAAAVVAAVEGAFDRVRA